MGIVLGALAIGTIVNSVQINVVTAEVSKLGREIAVLEKRADSNLEHTLALVSNVGSEVRLNSYFDTIDQVITMTRRDGEELLEVVRSTSTGELDPASRRELAEVVSKQMIPFGGGKVDNSQYQELRTTMTKSQAYSIEMEYTGVDRSCQGSTRKLTVITARPVVDGGNSYVVMWPNVYKSLAPGNKGSLFYANPFVKFMAEFKSQGEQVKLIPRLVQAWSGVVVHFHEGPELLVDYFLLTLTAEEGMW